jgi:hypothetical protein
MPQKCMKQETEVSKVQCEAYSFFLPIVFTQIHYNIFRKKRHTFQVESLGDLHCLPHQGAK